MNDSKMQIFSCEASQYLAERISQHYGQPLSAIKVTRFSDGEFQPVILESVRGSIVYFVQSTFPPADNLLELLMMIDAAKRASANYIVAVIPYFGLARQERKHKPRVSIGAKLAANLITVAGVDRIITMDLHAPQIQGFFDIPVDHLDSSAVFLPYLEAQDLSNVVFVSPDFGGVHRVRLYAHHFVKDMIICDKYRKKANEIAHIRVMGDVSGKDVIIIDDMVDTANTLCKVATILKEQGAKSVRAMCTHPVLSGDAYQKIVDSELTELIVCDTIPLKKEVDKIRILSVADLFAKVIRRVHEHESISSLFVT